MSSIEIREVDAARWSDFERLFEARGGPKYCWCMVWRRDENGKSPQGGGHGSHTVLTARFALRRSLPRRVARNHQVAVQRGVGCVVQTERVRDALRARAADGSGRAVAPDDDGRDERDDLVDEAVRE